MATDASQKTIYVSVPEFSTVSAASSGTVTAVLKGATQVAATTATLAAGYVAYVPTGGAVIDCVFLEPERDWYLVGTTLHLRTPAPANISVSHGLAYAPRFICRSGPIWIHNDNSAVIKFRKGTANYDGITIGDPGDTNAENVIGLTIPANGDLILYPGDFKSGEQVHLLASAASQTATIHFL